MEKKESPPAEKSESRTEKFSKNLGLISTALTIIEKVTGYFVQLPSHLTWIMGSIAGTLVIFWLYLRYSRNRYTVKAEDVDVEALLSEIAPKEIAPEPVVAETAPETEVLPEAKPRPLFHTYAKDEINGLRWEWKWKPEATEPHPDAIESLSCFCPKCGLRIDPDNERRTYSVPIDKPHPGILASVPPRTIPVTDFFARFACDNRCFGPIVRGVDLNLELKRVKREIERRAKLRT